MFTYNRKRQLYPSIQSVNPCNTYVRRVGTSRVRKIINQCTFVLKVDFFFLNLRYNILYFNLLNTLDPIVLLVLCAGRHPEQDRKNN